MRRFSLLLSVLLVVGVLPAHASTQPPGDISGVELVGSVPEAVDATSINFMTYELPSQTLDVMVVNGRFGLKTYDLRNPTKPKLLDELTSDELKLPSDGMGTFWQNEDMDVDEDRKLVFMARDPRAYEGTTSDPSDVAGVYIIDAADPRDLQLREFVELPSGHTSTCVNDCDYLWTGGPASNTEQDDEWPGGRPVFVTDIRDLDDITTSPVPIDTERNDGETAYAHDVQVDVRGIAWVSGLGGVRGYHTFGRHKDPRIGAYREATATDPIPFAGGGIDEADAPTSFMHNSFRPVGRSGRDGPIPSEEHPRGSLILATEEAFDSNTCDGVGMLNIASLAGSYDGESWGSTPEDPFRLETVGTWSPAGEEGTDTGAPFCSAHYFEAQDRVLAYSWYAQGTRFIDISDPANPVQIAYYRPDGGVSWAPYWHNGYVYVADHTRGVEILDVTAERHTRRPSERAVAAPAMSATQVTFAQDLATRYAPDPDLGWACVIPRF